MSFFIRLESRNDTPIQDQAWVEATMSMGALRILTQARVKELARLEGAEIDAQPGDAEICDAEGVWHPWLFWIPQRGTVLIEVPDEFSHKNCWMRPVIAELSKRLKATVLDDNDNEYEL